MSDVTVTSEADAVDKAVRWANALLTKVHRGPGDNVETAMHRAEAKWGVPAATFWALRYRRPKEMGVAAWFYLKAVYEAECERQEARLRHELKLTKEVLGHAASSDKLVAATEEFLEAVAEKETAE